MSRRFLVLCLIGLVGVLAAVVDGSAAPTTVQWGKAREVPGTATLNAGNRAATQAISCPTAGNCVGVGYYKDASPAYQAFVAEEKNGAWSAAIKLPGTAALSAGGSASADAIACAATGNCSAGGSYADGSGHTQAFVADEKKGTWHAAVEVPGTATLNAGGDANVNEISCPTIASCTAAGYYRDGAGHYQPFVATETNGTWADAIQLPGIAALEGATGRASVRTVSCGAPGDCATGGYYVDGSGNYQAFVATETNGIWGNAIEVPGSATLNAGGQAYVESVSCGASGHCAAGGYYLDGSGHYQAFFANETNGTWGNGIEVPGTATLNAGNDASVYWISCATANDCAAAGFYTDAANKRQAFVADEKNGVWKAAIEVPGTQALNTGTDASVYSVSCAGAHDCAAGGYYHDRSGNEHSFVANETNGTWGKAIPVPGMTTLNAGGNSKVYWISCATAQSCAAGGYYKDGSSVLQAYVVDTLPPRCVVPNVVGKPLATAKRKLKAAHCSVGKITHAYSTVKRGSVVSQSPKRGKHLRSGAKVALTVSKGKQP